ncbi:hypothetical protein Nepgr_004278 [Nepenthes gracilis]|uniref:Uncharacterized protein n=1 Tax=Nepenthes gracilis TaxID=150966 RepID=A0AAD3S1C0_NEPGR|nr:hypothetical protein Nepgr_004278 [Nepenthes gracilis]
MQRLSGHSCDADDLTRMQAVASSFSQRFSSESFAQESGNNDLWHGLPKSQPRPSLPRWLTLLALRIALQLAPLTRPLQRNTLKARECASFCSSNDSPTQVINSNSSVLLNQPPSLALSAYLTCRSSSPLVQSAARLRLFSASGAVHSATAVRPALVHCLSFAADGPASCSSTPLLRRRRPFILGRQIPASNRFRLQKEHQLLGFI